MAVTLGYLLGNAVIDHAIQIIDKTIPDIIHCQNMGTISHDMAIDIVQVESRNAFAFQKIFALWWIFCPGLSL